MTSLATVPFRAGDITVTTDQRVALKPVCEAMGLDFSGQRQRLQRTPWAVVGMTPTTGTDGKTYQMVTVDRRTFTMWLATIETSRLKNSEAREVVAIFQNEAADALDAYFHEGAAINERATEHQLNAVIRRAQMQMELAQASKGLIHPDHLEAKARIILATGMGEQPEIEASRRPLYTQDYLREKNLSRSLMKSIAGVFGKRVKKAYAEKTGRTPMQYPLNLSNGQIRNVNAYIEADRWILDEVWEQYYGDRAGQAAIA